METALTLPGYISRKKKGGGNKHIGLFNNQS